MARKKAAPPAGAPEWVVTYSDTMGLLLCFFIVLVSMSEIKQDQRFMQVMESLRKAFGGYEGSIGAVPDDQPALNSVVARLMEIELNEPEREKGDSDEIGIHGKDFRVTNVRDGLEVVVGGQIAFDRFSATLKPEARELVIETANLIRGYTTRIFVRGHATNEPLPPDSAYADNQDLSYARARAVADELVRNGVRRFRIALVAVGDTEPLVQQAYTEARRALNRRVEILVTEDLVHDYSGSTQEQDMNKESLDGR